MRGIDIFSTCPQSKDEDSDTYLRSVADVARWSEEAGCRGILVYTDNGLVDPWLVSQVILQSTAQLSPLVAVQPIYMHPYSVATMVSSLGFLHQRRVYLNMLAGGFKNDLVALDDDTPHDERYERTVEYTTVITRLLAGGPVSFEGRYYAVRNLSLSPPLPPELLPEVLISGSSPAGADAARRIGATAVRYPAPPGEEPGVAGAEGKIGIRVGIIARETGDEAWRVALERFPEDRKGQITHSLAMRVSDSQWHRQLSEMGSSTEQGERPTYWLGPFENYRTFCPYLVGSYEQVAQEIARYLDLGFRTFILDIPASREELEHVSVVFEAAANDAVR